MATSPFDNLTQAFAPQTQQAQLSTDQTRLLMQALRAEQGQRAYNANRPPQLDFNVDARTPFEGIAKGIGSGLSNGLQLRAYGQQNRALQQQQQQQQTYLAQQQALLQQQAQAESARQTNYLGSLKSNPVYAPLVMPYEMGNTTTRGDIEKLVADNEAKRTFTPLLGTATGQGKFNENRAIIDGAAGLGYGPNNLEVGGVPQAAKINYYRGLTGDNTPTLTPDLKKTQLVNEEIRLGNQTRSLKNDYLPLEQSTKLLTDKANMQIKQIEAAAKQAQIDLDIEAGGLKNDTSAAQLKAIERKQTLLTQASEFKQNIADQLKAGAVPTPAQLLQLDAYNAALTDTSFDLTKALKAIQNPEAGKPINPSKALPQKDAGWGKKAPEPPTLDLGLAPKAAKPLINAMGGLDMAAAQAGANREMATRGAAKAQANVTKGKTLLSQSQQMEAQARQGSARAKALMDRIDKALGM